VTGSVVPVGAIPRPRAHLVLAALPADDGPARSVRRRGGLVTAPVKDIVDRDIKPANDELADEYSTCPAR
jgi:hypothetical protein